MPTITHKGVKLAYESRGTGTPAFVFVHGGTCDRSFFAPQAKHFARRHRVVSLDLRGHGESDKPQGPYPIAAYADDIAFLIGKLGLGKVVAVGHSMGGMTVLELGAAHPDKVAAIVMVDPAPLVFPPGLKAGIEAIVAAIAAGNQEPRCQFIANDLFMKTSDKRLVKRVLKVMMAAPSHIAAAAMKGILAFDGPAAAARCKVPALHLAAQPPAQPAALDVAVAADRRQRLGRGRRAFQQAGGARAGQFDDCGLPASSRVGAARATLSPRRRCAMAPREAPCAYWNRCAKLGRRWTPRHPDRRLEMRRNSDDHH